MTKAIQRSAATCDAEAFSIEAAEVEFTLAVQCEIQKLLNSKGLRAKDLSKRLNVTEARVSQMFGEQAKNLTLKTIARIFYHLGETAVITTQAEFDRTAAGAAADLTDNGRWTVSGLVEDIEVALNISVDRTQTGIDIAIPGRSLNRWVRAEEAESVKPRRFATAR